MDDADDANGDVDVVVVDSIGNAENASTHLVYCWLTRKMIGMNMEASDIIFLCALSRSITNITIHHQFCVSDSHGTDRSAFLFLSLFLGFIFREAHKNNPPTQIK